MHEFFFLFDKYIQNPHTQGMSWNWNTHIRIFAWSNGNNNNNKKITLPLKITQKWRIQCLVLLFIHEWNWWCLLNLFNTFNRSKWLWLCLDALCVLKKKLERKRARVTILLLTFSLYSRILAPLLLLSSFTLFRSLSHITTMTCLRLCVSSE